MSTTTVPPITREQLDAFYLSGRGLEHARPRQPIRAAGFEAVLAEIPRLEDAYPLYIAPNRLPQPLIECPGVDEQIVRDVIAMMNGRAVVPIAEALAPIREWNEGYLIGFHPDAAVLLYGAFLEAQRRDARRAFFIEVKRCVAGLEDLLALDRSSRAEQSAETVTASLGAAAMRFLAANALTGIFDHSRRRVGMGSARLERCESALNVLKQALDAEKQNPSFWLFHSGEAPADLAMVHGRSSRHEDSCAAAIAFCDRQMAEFTGVLRALRAARLELQSAFDPDVHAAPLDRFDWRAAEAEELAALPAIVIAEQPARLAEISMACFERLLRSGRPIQILVPGCGPFAEPDSPDYGALAMMHREAFVLQSSLARWDHLANGLAKMTQVLRPALAVLSVPAAQQPLSDAWAEIALYDLSKTFPLYMYDPDSDFQLFDPGVATVLHAIQAMAISGRFREHFRVIPSSFEEIEAAEYFVSADSCRAVFTKELADLCRERRRAAEMLARLASIPEPKGPVADLEAARQEGAAQAYAAIANMLADPENLVAK